MRASIPSRIAHLQAFMEAAGIEPALGSLPNQPLSRSFRTQEVL